MLCAFVSACLSVVFCFYQVIIFRRAEKINADANQVGDERNRRASIFLPINLLKMAKIKTSWFDVSLCLWEKDRSKVYPVWLLVHLSKLVYAGIKASYTQLNTNNLKIVIQTLFVEL